MCDIWRDPERSELSVEAIRRLTGDLGRLRVQRIVLSGGEPLMHSDLWTLCRLLRDHGLAITVLTTGLLLKRHAAALVEHVDDIIVSLDGPQETHDLIRNKRAAFATMAAGIDAVRQAGPRLDISGRCTVQRLNCLELRATVRAAAGLGLDRISFLAVDIDTGAFNRPGGWEAARAAEVLVTADQLPLLRDEISALEREHAADFAGGFIVESPAKLRRRLWRHFRAVHGRASFAPITCNAPWVSSVVEADGTVRPCFFHAPIGNVHENGGLEAILNSPAAIAFRRSLDTRSDSICRRCVCNLNLRTAPGVVPRPAGRPATGVPASGGEAVG
jgi:MoaA/NifB/PqqE/SkfB family radical SAM enzyme